MTTNTLVEIKSPVTATVRLHKLFSVGTSGRQGNARKRELGDLWVWRSISPRSLTAVCLLVITSLLKFEKQKVLVTQSCPTLWDPLDCSPAGSSVPGVVQARIPEWVAISFSRGSSWSRDQTQVSCISRRFFTIWDITTSLLKFKYRQTVSPLPEVPWHSCLKNVAYWRLVQNKSQLKKTECYRRK